MTLRQVRLMEAHQDKGNRLRASKVRLSSSIFAFDSLREEIDVCSERIRDCCFDRVRKQSASSRVSLTSNSMRVDKLLACWPFAPDGIRDR